MAMPVTPDSSLFAYAGYTTDVRKVFRQVGMKPLDSTKNNDWSLMFSDHYRTIIKPIPVSKNTMPDLSHMTLKDALYEMESRNMKVVVRGRGKVVAQDIAPGSIISKNQTVTILMN